MDVLDIYDDLDEFHEQEEKKSKELLAVQKKYEETLKIVEVMKLEKKDLRKKIRIMEQNLQNLLDTAKAEIKRKDKIIDDLRKEKDDLCFRRQKHWTANKAEFIMPIEETTKDKSEIAYKIPEDNKKKEIIKSLEPSMDKLSEKEEETCRETIQIRDDFKNKEISKKTEEKHRERRGDDHKNTQRTSRKRSRDKSRERSLSSRSRDKSHRNRVKDDDDHSGRHRKDDHRLRRNHWNDRRDHSKANDRYKKLHRDHKNPFKSSKSSKFIEEERKSRKERDEDKRNDRNYESKRKDNELRKRKRRTSSNSDGGERHKKGWNSKADPKNDKLRYTKRMQLIKTMDCEDIESSDDDDMDMEIGMLPAVKSEIFIPSNGSRKTNKIEDYNKEEMFRTEVSKQDCGFDKQIVNIDGVEVKRILEQSENIAKYISLNAEFETKASEAKMTQTQTAKSNIDVKPIESYVEEADEKSFELSENITKKEDKIEVKNDFDRQTAENFEKEMQDSDHSSKSSTKDQLKETKEEGKSKIQELNSTSENDKFTSNMNNGIMESSTNLINDDDESMKKTDENKAKKIELEDSTILNELPPCTGNSLSKTFDENSNMMKCNNISSLPSTSSESETLMLDSKNSIENCSEKEEVDLNSYQIKPILIHNNDVPHCSDEGAEKEIIKSLNENSNYSEQNFKGTVVVNCDPKISSSFHDEQEKRDNCNIIGENVIVDEPKTKAGNIQTELRKLDEVSENDRGKKEQAETAENEIITNLNFDTKSNFKNDKIENTNSAVNESETVCIIDSSEDEMMMISSHSVELLQNLISLNQASFLKANEIEEKINKKCPIQKEIVQVDETVMDKLSEGNSIVVLQKEIETSNKKEINENENENENEKTPETIAEEDKLAMETDEDVELEINLEHCSTRKENTPSCIIELDEDNDDDDDDDFDKVGGNTIFSLTLSSDDDDENLAVLKNRCKQQKEKEKIEILENIRLPTLFQSNFSDNKVKKTPKKQNFIEKTIAIDGAKEEGKTSQGTLAKTAIVNLSENDKLKSKEMNSETNKSECLVLSQSKSIDLNSEAQTIIVINEDSSFEDEEISEIKGIIEVQENTNTSEEAILSKKIEDNCQIVKNPSDIVKEIGETSNAERESYRSLILAMENNVENFKEKFDECLNNNEKEINSLHVKANLNNNVNDLKAATLKSKKTTQLEEESQRNKSKERRSLAEHNGKLLEGVDKQKPSNSISELLSENRKETTKHRTDIRSNAIKKARLKISNRKNTSKTVGRNCEMEKKGVKQKCTLKSGARMSEKSFSKKSNSDMVKTPVKRKRPLSPTSLRNLFNDENTMNKTPKLSTSAEVRAMLIDDPQMSYDDVSIVNTTTCIVQDTNIDELDRDMEALFQSPAKLDISHPIIGCFPCGNSTALDATIDETNLETTFDNQNKTNDSSSFESKRLSLGSSQYVYERVSENVVNLFITRRRNKKSSNPNTTSPPCNVEQA